MKHLQLPLLVCLVSLVSANAAEENTDPDALYLSLMEAARDPQGGFPEAYAAAESGGVAEHRLAEANLLKLLVAGDFGGLVAFTPTLVEQRDSFVYGIGKTFTSKRQLDGLVAALRSVERYQEEDFAAFEELALSAHRDAPNFANSFGLSRLMADLRMKEVQEEAMANLRVPMDMSITSADGKTRTLGDWMGDNKALLIDFWASWCGPCIRAMPSLRAKAESLPEQGVFVAAMNTDDEEEQLDKAKKIRQEHNMGEVPWLLDPQGSELSGLLFVDSIPRMVLVAPDGSVLYNGHPLDGALDAALAKIGVTAPGHE